MNNNRNIPEEELGLIDRYLNKQLTETELSDFEQRIAAEPAFAEKLNEVQLLSLGIQETILSDKLDDLHKSIATNSAMPKAIKINWMKRLTAAASVVFFAGILSWLLFFQKNAGEQLYATYFKPDPGLPTLMGVSDNYEFEKAMVDYKTGNYQKALDSWQQLLKTNPDNDTLNYFIASAHLANNNSKQAFLYFDKVLAANSSVFLQDAKWYKALALLKEGKKDKAVTILKTTEHSDKEALLRQLEK